MVKIITFNVNGLASTGSSVSKRRKIFSWLKRKQCDIALLQETHCVNRNAPFWKSEWGGQCFFNNGTSSSGGVCTLIKPNANISILNKFEDGEGRIQFLELEVNNFNILVGNIYCPNRDETETMTTVNEWIGQNSGCPVILGGDFNTVLSPTIDRLSQNTSRNPDYCPQRRKAVLNTMKEFDLVDIWRKLHPSENQYTFVRGNAQSRLDFFLISDGLLHGNKSADCRVLPSCMSDHRAVELSLQLTPTPRGRSYWKFNNSLLTIPNFVQTLKEFLVEAIRLNDAPTLSKSTLFDTVLCMTRGKIIQYAAQLKRRRTERFEWLEEQIARGENGEHIAGNLDALLEERDGILNQIARGSMLRCKANWAAFAEKSSAYFFSLEKRYAVRRGTPSLFLKYSSGQSRL